MNEKEAKKRLKAIETEIRYLKKMIKRQKKILDAIYSERYTIKGIFIVALLGLIGILILLYQAEGGISLSGMICAAFFFILILVFLLMLVFLFRESSENKAWELRHGMECWLQYYREEKEKILTEYPNLKYEEIRPSRIHYWELLQYYSLLVDLFVFVLFLWFSRYPPPNPVVPYLYAIIFIMGIASYLHQRHYRNCPHKKTRYD